MPVSQQGSAPADIEMLYTPKVIRQLSWLRIQLDTDDVVDRFIMATILGMMHANYKPGSPARGFSISMPNTFSMSPAYVRAYIREHQLVPPEVDVFEMVLVKAKRMGIPGEHAARGDAWHADARNPERNFERRARLVFTSPPYLGVIKYGKYNWIRLWMLGREPRTVDTSLVATTSLRKYLAFIGEVLAGLQGVVDTTGFVCLMIGDVTNKKKGSTLNLAETVWRNTAEPAGWRLLGIVNDQLPEQHKVSRIWGREKKGRATKVDRILILAPPGSDHSLPPVPRQFNWNSASDWAEKPNTET
jgi:site-specific DNA-methyltransferase (adenine-specific)